jgi:hypothetical protein
VFTDLCVSVTCFVAQGRATWFLTKESGQAPQVCECLEDHQHCRVQPLTPRVRRGYVVVQVEGALHVTGRLWSEVLVARLSAAAVGTLEVLFAGEQISDERIAAAVELLERGLVSVDAGCTCTVTEVCDACIAVPGENRRFLCATVFTGVQPYGEEHWWCGVTDATREVSDGGELWLMCPSAWTRQWFLQASLWGDSAFDEEEID